jgi:flavin reductase (DIM6/NTAB) family NADH-FMN oxidoreductase RutF
MPLNPAPYTWPHADAPLTGWTRDDTFLVRTLPETPHELARDSRWPGFFPAPLCLVTTRCGQQTALEKVVGASIVNRFPYVVALSFCRTDLSARHHARRTFMQMLEDEGQATLQFLPPGPERDQCLQTILHSPERTTTQRLAEIGLPTRASATNNAPVFEHAYMAYEARLVRPTNDFDGVPIYQQSWVDCGSHRVYFLEINAIQLRDDLASGANQLHWRSLPDWTPTLPSRTRPMPTAGTARYQKGFTADYAFPSRNTIAFEADEFAHGMAVKHLPPLPADQVEIDNDRARWPCFFPSSVGMITCTTPDGGVNVMPCGSTTIVSRAPLTVALAVSYAAINARYAPRATLGMIRAAGRFGCGVPYRHPAILDAIRYAGNHSYADDPAKVAHSGLTVDRVAPTPRLRELPVHFDCRVVREIRLGTHILFLGEVERVSARRDVLQTPLQWCPWADVPELVGV